MTVADDLRKAADLIDTAGWWNGGDRTDPETHCALTAIGQIVDDEFRKLPNYRAADIIVQRWKRFDDASGALRDYVGVNYIPSWNDTRASSLEVTGAMREAAKVWEQKQ